ncbi:MAG: P-loop NTPase fold protein, partial [Flavobacteriales bacterium]
MNTWEYSMFRGAKETTPAVLNGLLASLAESCGDFWHNAKGDGAKLKRIGKFFGNLVNQVVANQLSVDVKSALDDSVESDSISRAEIAEIKNDISDIINKLIEDSSNPYQRVVFFVDDLDRINPSDAVEVLESLKNIFDLQHCIFILAIDYEVVVKGLEGKFGRKTEDNEREFRSFFDKIIQVPFSMPTGTYDIDSFLSDKLNRFGIQVEDKLMETYMTVVKTSVGYNPRSLKRFLNTFSLLNTIRKQEEEEEGQNHIELMLFAMLGIQISYPRIFRFLTMQPNYLEWDSAFAIRHQVDWSQTESRLIELGENDLLDETWEKVVWSLCQTDSYLKSRVYSILELLNALRTFFKEQLVDSLTTALEFAAITSVDDSHEAKQAVTRVGNKYMYEGIEAKAEDLIKHGSNTDGVKMWKAIWSMVEERIRNSNGKINYTATATTLRVKGGSNLVYCKNPAKRKGGGGMRMWLGWGDSTHEDTRALLAELDLVETENLEFASYGGLGLEINLINDFGKGKYEAFLMRLYKKILDV